jgi:RimJ/RimL family protein N-acetyltransferase
MEISDAKSPDSRPEYIPGIIKKACLKVSRLLGEFDGVTEPLTRIVAEIEPNNRRAIGIVKRSGFEYVGEKVWELNWNKVDWRK